MVNKMWKSFVSVLLGASLVTVTSVGAVDFFQGTSAGDPCSLGGKVCDSRGDNAQSMVTNVIRILLYVVGVASILMLIYGGIKYVTAGGDSSSIASAKNTILYAVIGLVAALLAGTIAAFVAGRF